MARQRQFWISALLMVASSIVGLHSLPAQDDKRPADTSLFFDQAHSALENALELFDQQPALPAESELPFYDYLSRTQESQQQRVDSYLDVAAEALGISRINERRQRIAAQRKLIADARMRISAYQRYQISAPDSTYNPLTVTKSGYGSKIEREESRIQVAEAEISTEKEGLANQLQSIGMKISEEDVDTLLDSITGDEFVRVSIIFDNAKNFALELERLTDATGEDLATAKKYYGVYLMLLHSIDRLQQKFIEKVDSEYYPQLSRLMEQAQRNIDEAREGIKVGADRQQLESNIYNNEVTLEVATYYKQSLREQKQEMQQANEKIKSSILTATNTYKTASLSKDIASLIAVSRRAFDSITALSVPDLRPFANLKLKDEFSRMARELRK